MNEVLGLPAQTVNASDAHRLFGLVVAGAAHASLPQTADKTSDP